MKEMSFGFDGQFSVEAMIQSMTKQERADPYVLIREPRRAERIAKGSGGKTEAVGELVQRFLFKIGRAHV